MKPCYVCIYDSPIGTLYLSVDEQGRVLWCDTEPPPKSWECKPDWEACSSLVRELQEYFSGSLQKFSLPIVFEGTEFERRVYAALLNIPYGETVSYAEIAKLAESAKASRAAGSAIGKNHLLLLIPCHRVVPIHKGPVTKEIIGKYRAGSDAKRFLLHLEGIEAISKI
ncbi:MAG: methylated-DNA--[protein]-cysteine S-methyltransferase [Bacteroidetes bacterium]|nr:methylated-DNA--[protein]-cysteine S-methyltransferase [Bacteroidota bacterium]